MRLATSYPLGACPGRIPTALARVSDDLSSLVQVQERPLLVSRPSAEPLSEREEDRPPLTASRRGARRGQGFGVPGSPS
jgi:hypothetical protein